MTVGGSSWTRAGQIAIVEDAERWLDELEIFAAAEQRDGTRIAPATACLPFIDQTRDILDETRQRLLSRDNIWTPLWTRKDLLRLHAEILKMVQICDGAAYGRHKFRMRYGIGH